MKILVTYGKVKSMYSGRNELSKKNKYHISKYRFLELKYFCLQYDEFKSKYNAITYYSSYQMICAGNRYNTSDRVLCTVEERDLYRQKMEVIEQSCVAADPDIYSWLLRSVTQGIGYQYLIGIPCCKDTFYDRYHKFFWILSQKLQGLL